MNLCQHETSLGMFWVLSGCLLPLVHARGFLVHRASSIRNGTGSRVLAAELSDAMGEALGCGGRVSEGELSLIEQRLAPMWQTLPKTLAGNVERRSLRYAVHRYFNRASSLHIRGFEPSRPPTPLAGEAMTYSRSVCLHLSSRSSSPSTSSCAASRSAMRRM